MAAAKESEDGVKYDKETSRWVADLTKARKREEKYRARAKKVKELYEAEEGAAQLYNILYPNTQILLPSIYSQPPRAVVKPKYKSLETTEPIVVQGAQYGQAILQQIIDTGENDRISLHSACEAAAENALVVDRGVVRVKYEAQTEGPDDALILLNENVDFEVLEFDEVLFGYASNWNALPWVAFRHILTKDEFSLNYGKDIAAKVKYTANEYTEDEGRKGTEYDEATPNLAVVYEIWDKRSKEVIFVSPGLENVIKRIKDPLGLEGFFPMPEPLSFGRRFRRGKPPIPLYFFYEQQANEVNELTRRISKVINAIKVRGLFDSSMQGLETLLSEDDNAMLPVDNMAAISAATGTGGGFDKAIWFLPIETLVNVLNTLVMQRQNSIQVIYEITGISDLLRGNTKASETLGAQELKSQWGTTRIKKLQGRMSFFVRDLLRLSAEVVVKKFSPETVAKMISNSPHTVDLTTLTAVLNSMRRDYVRNFNIDIETNSSVTLEATGEKEEVTEFLTAVATFLTGVGPAVESGSIPFKVAKGILSQTVKKFRFGQELEQMLSELPDELPKKPDPMAEKVQAEMKRDDDKHQREMQKLEANKQADQQKAALEQQIALQELQVKQRELQNRERELALEMEYKEREHQMNLQMLQAKVIAARAMPQKPAGGSKKPSNGQARPQ